MKLNRELERKNKRVFFPSSSTLNTSGNVEEDWAAFRDTVHAVALHVVRPTARRRQDWIDESDDHIRDLLHEKHSLHRALLNDLWLVNK